jgi:hypothetical protein
MISVVNGYICTSSCDVGAAKQGKDPAASPGSVPGTSSNGLETQPAAVLDGALKDFASTNTATGTSTSPPAIAQQKVNLLA